MDLAKLSEPLRIDQIDFRVQSITNKGLAIILAYKDARADMQRLDDVVGPLNWKREHSRDNHNCIVSIYNKDIGEWVSKEDTGTESNTEAQKGLASDSFKRACFNWGIGRELYDYPFICVQLNSNEWFLNDKKKDRYGNPTPTAKKEFRLKEWKWYHQFSDGQITFLAAQDNHKQTRYTWGTRRPTEKAA